MGNYQEVVGRKFVSRVRTISDGEFNILQDLTWQTARIHTDGDYMKNTEFSERIMSGSILLSVAMGLEGNSDLRPVLKTYGIVDVGALGVESIQFIAPVNPGDSLWSETEILEIRPSRKNPKRLVVRLRLKCFKKPDTLVMDSLRASLRKIED
jgi:acyl dehydratase